MSDLNQIHTALERLFNDEGQRIVFWNDPDREFLMTVPLLELDGVTTLRLDQVGALEAKLRLEREEPNSRFLLYAPAEEPDYEDDWLLDIRLYSRSFRADRASILLQELGLVNLHLRTHVSDRRKFFDAKDRLQKIKQLVTPEDTAADLDRKMIAVIAKADQPELFNIVRTLFHAWNEGLTTDNMDSTDDKFTISVPSVSSVVSEQLKKTNSPSVPIREIRGSIDLDLDTPPTAWTQLEKFDLDLPFWHMVKAAFGYEEDNPQLKNFLLRLMLTDFAHHLKADLPRSLRGLLLPESGWSNAVVCLAQWRDSSSRGTSYDRLSAEAAAILRIEDQLPNFEIDELAEVMTFLVVEKRIASGVRDLVQSTAATINAGEVRSIVARRQTGHWASLSIADTPDAPRQALHAVYDALLAATRFYDLRNNHPAGFEFPDAAALYRAYESELYQFDQLYRHFCEAADTAEEQGWNIVKPLRDDVEAHYVNWYLTSLALAWGRFMEGPQGLLARWQIDKLPNQFQFYDRHVKPWLDEADNRRAFVIISDAFRYEAAQELMTELNGKYRLEATLSSQLGVLPSYTTLGMASLLPHKTLTWKGTDVLVDGQSGSAGERDGILQSVQGMACRWDDLMARKKDEGRELVREKRVVYIYHNTVDAIGDDGKTEGHTFQAVRSAIGELSSLVGYIVNKLNGNHVLITADHGFLFTETPRVETDKSRLDEKPPGTLLAKKRYLIGTPLHDHDVAWHGRTSITAGIDGEMEFWIPKGANLFHFVGGARFVHGGAMPQEIVVPVVSVKHRKDKVSRVETKTRAATVQVLGSGHRITTAQHRFQLIQMDAVSDRVKPITLRVAVYDGEEPVTDIQTVKFESSSGNLDERKKWVSLVLKERQYNKKTPYRLVLRDAETGIEQQSVEVIIDRAFTDDF